MLLFLEQIETLKIPEKNIMYLDTGNKIIRFNVSEIIYFYRREGIVYALFSNQQSLRIFNTIHEIREKISTGKFFPVSEDLLVNLNFMVKYIPEDHELILSNGKICRIFPENERQLLAILDNWK